MPRPETSSGTTGGNSPPTCVTQIGNCTRNLAIYGYNILHLSADAHLVAIDARIPMLEQWSAKTGMLMDRAVGGPDPLRDWEVFFWTPR